MLALNSPASASQVQELKVYYYLAYEQFFYFWDMEKVSTMLSGIYQF